MRKQILFLGRLNCGRRSKRVHIWSITGKRWSSRRCVKVTSIPQTDGSERSSIRYTASQDCIRFVLTASGVERFRTSASQAIESTTLQFLLQLGDQILQDKRSEPHS